MSAARRSLSVLCLLGAVVLPGCMFKVGEHMSSDNDNALYSNEEWARLTGIGWITTSSNDAKHLDWRLDQIDMRLTDLEARIEACKAHAQAAPH